MKERSIVLLMMAIIIYGLSSCKKEEQSQPSDSTPVFSGIAIDGNGKNYEMSLSFNTGVYANNDISGDLDESHFNVTVAYGSAQLSSYSVVHNAGNKIANIKLNFDKDASGLERVSINNASGASIYNNDGTLMPSDQIKTISTDGIEYETITIEDDGSGTGTTNWIATNTYLLDGLVFVNEGQTLTIEAGTVIKGKSGQGENASALIVARGGTIIADGTKEKPIVFTSEDDDLNGSIDDLESGKWGGLIILGKAGLNTLPNEQQIEGIPAAESRGVYGGTDDEDNSGILRYISIRHGGTDIGEGNEINGLTLGGVGSQTTIEFIEVFANRDDGVEIFGGTARLKNILVAFVGDDSFDYDQGYRGYGQFWAGIQGFERGDRLGEHDGGTNPELGEPLATPIIYNTTYVGRGQSDGNNLITFRYNAGGHYANSIFYDQTFGIDIELLAGDCSYDQYENNNLSIKNNIIYGINDPYLFVAAKNVGTEEEEAANESLASYFVDAGNSYQDPGFELNGLTFDIVPSANVSENMADLPTDNWFTQVNYKGAIDPEENWAKGWTLFSKYMNRDK